MGEQRESFHRATSRHFAEFSLILDSADPCMQQLLANARRAAVCDSPILLTGEKDTGKGHLARQIHLWSSRGNHPFLRVECKGRSERLLESELFGDTDSAVGEIAKEESGALKAAHGSSILLNEISGLAARLQTKLLHFLKEQSFERTGCDGAIHADARIIAASSHDLISDVGARRFREDLYYRLGVITLCVPALRQRQTDIMSAATSILVESAVRNRRPARRFSPEASSIMLQYGWPGNLKELGDVIERLVLSCPDELVTPDWLPDVLNKQRRAVDATAASSSLEQVERDHIVRVLAESSTLESAAHKLGINVVTLWRRRKRYGLDTSD